MGFFKKAKEAQQLTEEQLKELKLRARASYALADIFDEEVLKPDNKNSSLHEIIKKDLAFFMVSVANADDETDQAELDLMNEVLGTNIDLQAAAGMVDKDQFRFTRNVPETFRLLNEYCDCCLSDLIAYGVIDIYEKLGDAIAAVDGRVEKEENWEINGFIAMLRRYARWD